MNEWKLLQVELGSQKSSSATGTPSLEEQHRYRRQKGAGMARASNIPNKSIKSANFKTIEK